MNFNSKNKLALASLGEAVFEPKVLDESHFDETIIKMYYRGLELAKKEDKIFADSMKEATGGHDLILTNSK